MATVLPRASKRLRLSTSACRFAQPRLFSTTRCLGDESPADKARRTREEANKTTHFGFETIAESLKESKGMYNIPITAHGVC